MTDFGFSLQETTEGLIVRINGILDEESDLDSLDLGKHKVVVFDLAGIKMINSLGVRNWIIWSRNALRERIVTFRNCPRVIVDQINMVAQFLPEGSRVESFFTPYQCDNCEESIATLFQQGREFSLRTSDAPPKIALPHAPNCPNCTSPMTLDVIEAKYFRFIKL